MFEYINETAVIVASLLALAVGNVWYSALAFGPLWLRAQGKDPQGDILPESRVGAFIAKSIIALVCYFSLLAFLEMRLSAAGLGVSETLLIMFGLIASYMIYAAVWERKPLSYLLINLGYVLLVTYGGSAVITYWPW